MSGSNRGSTGESREPETLGMLIDGEWCQSESEAVSEAINPATGETIATIPEGTREDARRAIDAAADAQAELEFRSNFERAALVHELADAVERERDHLAEWLTRDQGKPLGDARREVGLVVEMFRGAAEDIKRDEPPTIPSEHASRRIFTVRKPHGVYGVITPWNFPLTIPSEYLAPGLAVGNAMVWVAAPTTSAISVKFAEVLAGTSLPDGALNLVTGPGPVVGNEVVKNDGVDAVGFTGSPETGDLIAREAGAKPTLLELGGNGPVIVLEDANVDAAAKVAASGCFANAGQICTASERILVHEDLREEFVSKVVAYAEGVAVGDPMDEATEMGPLNNETVAEKMDRHVRDAVDAGATVLHGGQRTPGAPTDLFYEPTVLDGVGAEMAVNSEETFGPIAPVLTFSSNDEAIEIANSIDLGLSSGVFTNDIETMYYFVDRIETGLVNVNQGSANWEIHTPIGGYSGKNSGVGRLGGRYTLEEVSQLKTVIVDNENANSSV